MWKTMLLMGCMVSCSHLRAQQTAPEFEVATIKPVDPAIVTGHYIWMEGNTRFIAKNCTLRMLIAAAYDLNPRMISGGPGWISSDIFVVQAITPGEERPDRELQMVMLRKLLRERFHLTFHRQEKEVAIYELTLAKDGPKLKETETPEDQPKLASVVYEGQMVMPARNASMSDLAATMQRAILDRPVVDRTGLPGRFDFELEWTPDDTQFDGAVRLPENAPPLATALQKELGLQLKPAKGKVDTLVIDAAEKPTDD